MRLNIQALFLQVFGKDMISISISPVGGYPIESGRKFSYMIALKTIRGLTLTERDIISEPYMINHTIGNGSPHVYGNAVMHIVIT